VGLACLNLYNIQESTPHLSSRLDALSQVSHNNVVHIQLRLTSGIEEAHCHDVELLSARREPMAFLDNFALYTSSENVHKIQSIRPNTICTAYTLFNSDGRPVARLTSSNQVPEALVACEFPLSISDATEAFAKSATKHRGVRKAQD
jgi:hypothetical protein